MSARARLAVASAFASTLLHALLRLLPWVPRFFVDSLDASWEWTLHEGWLRGWVSGRDLVFTYGPFGFVPGGFFHPETYGTSLLVHAMLVSVMALAVWSLLRRWSGSAWRATAWSAIWIEANRLFLPGESMFAHLAMLLLLAHFVAPGARAWQALVHALAVSAALAALFKFTLFLGAFASIACVGAERILCARRFPWVAATFAASLAAWWLVAGQPLEALSSYLSFSVHVSAGYSEAMAIDGPQLHLLLFVPGAALVCALLARVIRAEGVAARLLLHLGLLGQSFLLFKAAFVRHDEHAVHAPMTLLPWLVLGSCAADWRAMRPGRVVPSAALVLSLALVVFPFATGSSLPRTIWRSLAALPEDAGAAWRVLTGSAGYRRDHRSVLAAIREGNPLPSVDGTVDVYPALTAIALAHGLEYRPRPVFQSYCAYTPELLRLNADRLAGPAAPEHVFFEIDPIDGRYPALEDSLSWLPLLSRYDFAGMRAQHAWLRRSATPSEVRLRQLATRELDFGSLHLLPETPPGTLLWAQLELEPTVAGRAATWCLRSPAIMLTVRQRDGTDRNFRLVPSAARAGFLLSPLIADTNDFARLARGRGFEGGDQDVVALGVSCVDTLSFAYAPTCRLDVSVLELIPTLGPAPPR